jgi:phosphotransferase system enzyme I (PtsI)
MMSQHFTGAGGTPGIAIGQVFRYVPHDATPPASGEDTATALQRFTQAQQLAAARLQALHQQLLAEGRDDEAAIVDTQVLLVEDAAITEEVTRLVQDEHVPLEQALRATIEELRTTFAAMDDAYLRERAADMAAVGRILLARLRGEDALRDRLPANAIVVAPDLTPAETAELRGGVVAGFATAYGGATGHTAILARSLGIPAVVGLGAEVLALPDGTEVVLDGDNVLLIATPTDAERHAAAQRQDNQQTLHRQRELLREQPGQLSDGHRVALWANVGRPEEVQAAIDAGAEGIGLFRTEFLFFDRQTPPDEDEQFATYRRVLEMMGERPVVVRTIDIGGDKDIPYLHLPREANPFLGVRGVRLCMEYPDLFQTQVRALLRAAPYGNLWVMIPMVATPADFIWAREQFRAAAATLASAHVTHTADMRLGIMVETPAAAVTVDLFIGLADFMSIGSNDLTQYTMAADRGNGTLTRHYPHSACAVLRLIAQAATAASAAGIPLGICGELAADPVIAPLLVGMGVSELSMAPAAIPHIKERLLTTTAQHARTAAQRAITACD